MLLNLCATDIAALLSQYWYIAVAAVIVLGIIIAAVIVCLKKIVKQAKENSAVNKARREQIENSRKVAEAAPVQKPGGESEEPAEEQAVTPAENSADGAENLSDENNQIAEENTALPAENKENITMEKKQKTETQKAKAPVEEETEIVVEGQPAAEDKTAAKALYRVIYDKENKEWMVKKDGAARVIRRVKTKAEALELANQFATNQDLSMVVQKKDGKFQKKSNYNKMITPAKGEKKK